MVKMSRDVRAVRDRLRGESGPYITLSELVDPLRHDDGEFSWRIVARASQLTGKAGLPNESLIEFIGEWLEAQATQRVLDSWSRAGLVLAAVDETTVGVELTGIVPQPDELRVAEELVPEGAFILEQLVQLRDDGRWFDLIVAMPPWGAKSVVRDDPEEFQRLDIDVQCLLGSAELLADDGRMIFCLPDRFLATQRSALAVTLLADRNIYPWSVVAVPSAWTNSSFVPTSLFEFRHGNPGEVLAGKASAETDNWALLSNLRARRAGTLPELGVHVATEDFESWGSLESDLQFIKAVKPFGTMPVNLDTVAVEQNRIYDRDGGSFAERPNCVYVPLAGHHPVITSSSAMSMEPSKYAQVVLDPSKASADYVAKFLNSHLGRLALSTAATGVMPSLPFRNVGHIPLVLPNLDEQATVSEIQDRLDDVRAQIEATEGDLWRTRNGLRSAKRILQNFSSEDSVEAWLPRLPFPLASILWSYQASQDVRRQTDILFAFFEAAAEFTVTILLSGLRADPQIYEIARSRSGDVLNREALTRASMGSWRVIGENLSKTVRDMLSDTELRPSLLDAFRCSQQSLQALSHKELFGQVQEIGHLRNEWKGHGGIAADQEIAERFELLQSKLGAMFPILTGMFEDFVLFRPSKSEFNREVHRTDIEELQGFATPFRETTVDMIRSLVANTLYLQERGASDALELVPLVRMRAGVPTEDACYFYSRMGDDGARFVSYHQARESEMTEPDADLTELIEELGSPLSSSESD